MDGTLATWNKSLPVGPLVQSWPCPCPLHEPGGLPDEHGIPLARESHPLLSVNVSSLEGASLQQR